MFEIKIFVAQGLLSKHETGRGSVFNNFIESKLLERFHSSNLAVNHPVGRKPASVWPLVDSQVCPRGPGDVATAQQVVYGPAPRCTHWLAVQQPVDILRPLSAPLIQRYLDLSGSDI